jgi:hypothetical protein
LVGFWHCGEREQRAESEKMHGRGYFCLLAGLPALLLFAAAQPESSGPVIRTGYHLTARPWKPLGIPRGRYLDVIEGVCRYSIRHQDASGAIIDPFLRREHQYATPYFAYAVGTVLSAGRAPDLLPYGVRAMEHATRCFAAGSANIPDQHGNFFIAPLTGALELYEGRVPDTTMKAWRARMRTPRSAVVSGGTNNWETYVMKGEWMRVAAGLADRADATAAIEEAWTARQRSRVAPEPWRVYHDRTSDPDTLAVEAVGRGNLLALTHLGYDGPSAREIREAVEAGSRLSLLLQDPSGQAPANGRTDDHVWGDVGYQLAFEVMAARTRRDDPLLAGQFRHAAMLAFQSIGRWRREDGPWAGSYYVTKNRFDPTLRVGHQPASQYSNYNGSLMFHLAEAYRACASDIEERPAPAEIGGYAVAMDSEFASAVANAGGMQMQVNLRGQTEETHGNRWTPLGVIRFGRLGWDTRLGPSDGALIAAGGISFAPAFLEDRQWLRLADLSARYEGVWSVQFVHPLLVRCAVEYRPKPGQAGPSFRNEFTITPDGVLSTVRKTSADESRWGVTWPLLENDGRELQHSIAARLASTGYPGSPDRQNFVAVGGPPELISEAALRSTYGDLRALRVTVAGKENLTFVYPSAAGDPPAEAVARSFEVRGDGFRSILGRVSGNLYIGRTAAGGFGRELDLNGDGRPEVAFDRPCGFLLELEGGAVVAAETDRAAGARIAGRPLRLQPYSPMVLQRGRNQRFSTPANW